MIRRAKLLSPLLVIVMLFSLMSGVLTAVVVTSPETALASPGPEPMLVVNITSPVAPVTYSTCQNFTVNVTVNNTGVANATGVNVTISFNNTLIELMAPDVNITLGNISANETKQESWELHCNGSGATLISVNITAGNDTNTGAPILAQNIENATVIVDQQNKTHLVVNITSPVAPVTYSTCQNFTLTVNVTNSGEATATGVKVKVSFNNAYVELGPGESKKHTIGSINGSETKQESWELHCNGSGATSISVNIIAGNDTNTDEPIPAQNIENDAITVDQENKTHLVVNITSPVAPVTYSTCQNFTLTVNVTNSGEATATGVKVKVSFNNTYVELQAGQVAEHVIGSINGSETKQENWELHCNGSGATLISVNITAGNDTDTGQPILAQNIENATVIVNQQNKTHLVVNITSPVDGTDFDTCQNFTVTANVTNAGQATAKEVYADIRISGNALIVSGADPQPLGDIGANETKTANWTLHCDSPGDTTITVTAAGIDANTDQPIPDANIDPDSVTVHQAAPGWLSGFVIAGIAVGGAAAAAGIYFAIRKWLKPGRVKGE